MDEVHPDYAPIRAARRDERESEDAEKQVGKKPKRGKKGFLASEYARKSRLKAKQMGYDSTYIVIM